MSENLHKDLGREKTMDRDRVVVSCPLSPDEAFVHFALRCLPRKQSQTKTSR